MNSAKYTLLRKKRGWNTVGRTRWSVKRRLILSNRAKLGAERKPTVAAT
jgi:hypothetical protein